MLCYCVFAEVCPFSSSVGAWPLIIHSATKFFHFARPFDFFCFLLPLPAFTCALPLSAGRTGQQDDLLPEFDVEIMPGTAPRLHSCLAASHLLASLTPPHVRFSPTNQKLSLTNNTHIHLSSDATLQEPLIQPDITHELLLKPHKEKTWLLSFSYTSAHDLNSTADMCWLSEGIWSGFCLSPHPEEVCC